MKRLAPTWFEHDTALAAASALAVAVAGRLEEDLGTSGAASLVVSGGATPLPFFRALSMQPLDWGKVTITLADERWVPTDHPDSNEALVREHLLTHRAGTARLVGLWRATEQPEQAITAVAATLARVPQPFSAVVLGMGLDGHTASLFPGGAAWGLDPEDGRTIVTGRAPVAPHARLSLTLRTLIATRSLFLHITGAAKRHLLQSALSESGPELPVTAVLAARSASIYYAP